MQNLIKTLKDYRETEAAVLQILESGRIAKQKRNVEDIKKLRWCLDLVALARNTYVNSNESIFTAIPNFEVCQTCSLFIFSHTFENGWKTAECYAGGFHSVFGDAFLNTDLDNIEYDIDDEVSRPCPENCLGITDCPTCDNEGAIPA